MGEANQAPRGVPTGAKWGIGAVVFLVMGAVGSAVAGDSCEAQARNDFAEMVRFGTVEGSVFELSAAQDEFVSYRCAG